MECLLKKLSNYIDFIQVSKDQLQVLCTMNGTHQHWIPRFCSKVFALTGVSLYLYNVFFVFIHTEIRGEMITSST